MGLNRLRGMWLSEEEPGQAFLFKDIRSASEAQFEAEASRKPARGEERVAQLPARSGSENQFNAMGEQLRMLLDQCLDVVHKDPEVALRGRTAEWDIWFDEPLLSSIRTSSLPLMLKLRLLAFMTVMLPFLDEREQERVRAAIAHLTSPETVSYGEILTEQDLIHTQWLVRGVRRSRDIQGQMEALRRSILRRVPNRHTIS
ncbi:MAG: hypothetical protein KJ050_16395 [Candidatus Omnitrophica bacterium]|jgi:hypothetical protein|nr:MAG: hypothetical protein UZ16_OP3001001932 [Candidatus Hinthialibacteria bacterium OLB16]MBE7489950.1 hypothetical protein [bacterium]MBK7496866.1 hypothetical protein [Candidatus Omnitrophota bacterium]MBV6481391.1 hypothetical protein [bacterium]MBW7940408.1 hypothetical protein [Candidatus Omnitrophota bacterium]